MIRDHLLSVTGSTRRVSFGHSERVFRAYFQEHLTTAIRKHFTRMYQHRQTKTHTQDVTELVRSGSCELFIKMICYEFLILNLGDKIKKTNALFTISHCENKTS